MTNKKNILYINNGAGLSDVQSGGTLRHVEVTRVVKQKHNVFALTTTGGQQHYRNSGFKFDREFLVAAHLWKTKESSNTDRIFSYLTSTTQSLYLIFSRKLPKADFVYATSDYFCDVVPAVFYKILYKSKYISMVHHRAVNPFKRSGNFIFNTLSYLFQRLSFGLIHIFSDALLVYDTPEGVKIVKKIQPKKHFYVKNGIDFTKITKVPKQKKQFEVSFAGGLRETKGIYDLIPIWSKIVKKHPMWRIAVAGGGTEEVTKDFMKKIKKANLTKNFVLTGPLLPQNLYELIKSSKVFLSTSHEEGWGIAVLEAIALGIPVVAFELPAFKYLKDLIVRIPKFNHRQIANEIERVIENESFLKKFSNKGPFFAKRYDWNKIGREEIEIINEI